MKTRYDLLSDACVCSVFSNRWVPPRVGQDSTLTFQTQRQVLQQLLSCWFFFLFKQGKQYHLTSKDFHSSVPVVYSCRTKKTANAGVALQVTSHRLQFIQSDDSCSILGLEMFSLGKKQRGFYVKAEDRIIIYNKIPPPNQIDSVIWSVFVVYFSLVLICYQLITLNRNQAALHLAFCSSWVSHIKAPRLMFDIPAIIITRVRMLLLICVSVDLDLVHQHHDSTK